MAKKTSKKKSTSRKKTSAAKAKPATKSTKSRSGRRTKTPELFDNRVKTLQKRLRDDGLDGVLISNPRDTRYLTGFIGDDSWTLVTANGRATHIITDGRFEEQVANEAPHAKAIIRKGALPPELEKLMDKLKVGKLALQAEYATLAESKRLAKQIGAKRLVPWSDGLITQRAVKTADEVKRIRQALAIQQNAFLKTLEFIDPGMSEEQIAGFLEYQMRSLGADGVSFPTIVAVDANASLPHAIPGRKKVKRGSSILIDWGAKYGGYCSDLTRVVAVGKMSKQMQEIYKVTLEAQIAGIEAIGPGVKLADVDAAARTVIEDAGYGRQFSHSLGHGIGLDIHEQPVLSGKIRGELQPGHIVTVEPGIYLPGVGGVRIEDDVEVTEKGYRILSDLPKDLESAII